MRLRWTENGERFLKNGERFRQNGERFFTSRHRWAGDEASISRRRDLPRVRAHTIVNLKSYLHLHTISWISFVQRCFRGVGAPKTRQKGFTEPSHYPKKVEVRPFWASFTQSSLSVKDRWRFRKGVNTPETPCTQAFPPPCERWRILFEKSSAHARANHYYFTLTYR